MAKYDPLQSELASRHQSSVTLSFEEIERVVGASLPKSARTYGAWWSNDAGGAHVQARAWMDAGFRVDGFDARAGWVRFTRG